MLRERIEKILSVIDAALRDYDASVRESKRPSPAAPQKQVSG